MRVRLYAVAGLIGALVALDGCRSTPPPDATADRRPAAAPPSGPAGAAATAPAASADIAGIVAGHRQIIVLLEQANRWPRTF